MFEQNENPLQINHCNGTAYGINPNRWKTKTYIMFYTTLQGIEATSNCIASKRCMTHTFTVDDNHNCLAQTHTHGYIARVRTHRKQIITHV